MENSYPQTQVSVDELAAYLAYALRILKNCELPCEGITTPGGFGGRSRLNCHSPCKSRCAMCMVRRSHITSSTSPTDKESTQPRIEHVSDADSDHASLDRQHLRRHGRLVRRMGRRRTATRRSVLQPRRHPRENGGTDRAWRTCHHALPLARHVHARHQARFRRPSASRVGVEPSQGRQSRLDEAQRNCPLLGRQGIDTHRSRLRNSTCSEPPFACPQFTVRVPARVISRRQS